MKTLRAIAFIVLIILANPVGSNAQAWQYSEEFGTDFFTSQLDRKIEVVNCNTGTSEMKSIGTCMRKDVANGFSNGYVIKSKMPNLNGLNAKVARGVAASRPNAQHLPVHTNIAQEGQVPRKIMLLLKNISIGCINDKSLSASLRRKKREEERRRRIEDEIRVQPPLLLQMRDSRVRLTNVYKTTVTMPDKAHLPPDSRLDRQFKYSGRG